MKYQFFPNAISNHANLLPNSVTKLWRSIVCPTLMIVFGYFAVAGATFTVVNNNDSGTGSFRQAILDSNAASGADTIAFNIAPGGTQTIVIATMLPTVTDPVVIDGSTQPQFSGTPLVVIDGINITGSNTYGLRISAGNSLVRGLVIHNFQVGNALRIDSLGGNTIQGNYIGTDVTGTLRRLNDTGIGIYSSSNNLVGGTTASQRNVISGSRFENLEVGQETVNNQIKGNFIGTNAQGTASIGSGSYGITNGGLNTLIGGLDPGAGNLISGNGSSGIYLGGRDATVQGNLIGTDVTGTLAVPNTSSGIYVSGGGGALIGGTSAAARNILSGNTAGITYAASNFSSIGKIEGNYIGTDITGTAPIPNSTGIRLDEAAIVGGLEVGAGNLISGNTSNGIFVDASNSVIQGNLIGTDVSGSIGLSPNTQIGIMISDSNTLVGGGQVGARNIISGNSTGIRVGGLSSSSPLGNQIIGNLIGTDKTGLNPIPNRTDGIQVVDSTSMMIGGPNIGDANLIAFNIGKGVIVTSSFNPTSGVSIRGNSIFQNTQLGIDLGVQGVRLNDGCDVDTGPNGFQNYPVLASATRSGNSVNIVGSLDSSASANFTVDFYLSQSYDASNFGEGKSYIGSAVVTAGTNCTASINATLTLPSAVGRYVTATATDANGNTSEFSQYVTGSGLRSTSIFDFDGDSKTDIGIYRPNGGSGSEWWLQRSSNGNNFAVQFGAPTDKVAAADYTGDGKTDIGFWRPSTGFWYVLRSEDLTFYAFPFGANGDVPAPADYDADGKADVAVFRESATTWYIQRSSDGGTTIQGFGAVGDVPVNADYDGDGKADIAIYRPSLGQWWLMRSTAGTVAYQFGASTDKTVVGDYTGDGKADVAFWRPSSGEWFVLRSEDNSFFGFPFGISTDTPVPGDYDGDGRNDAGVFRSSNNTWYIQRTTAGTLIQQFGATGDLPLPNAYVR